MRPCLSLAHDATAPVPVPISRRVLADDRLSLAARGLYAVITLADEQANRGAFFADQRSAVEVDTSEPATSTALGELVAAGYAIVRGRAVTMLAP